MFRQTLTSVVLSVSLSVAVVTPVLAQPEHGVRQSPAQVHVLAPANLWSSFVGLVGRFFGLGAGTDERIAAGFGNARTGGGALHLKTGIQLDPDGNR